MDGNKDDALKCLKICREAIKAGDRAQALKFLSKARRLDPDLPIDYLKSELNNQSDEPGSAKSAAAKATPKSSDRPSLRQRGPPSSGSYTDVQIWIVRKIKSKKDYYEILGLENSCSVDDVRNAYRKLSMEVHPLNNAAPGSEEAFISVTKAFHCLNNEEARKKYDLSGSARTNGSNGGHYEEEEFDPNKIFRSFFFDVNVMPPWSERFPPYDVGDTPHRTANNNHQAPFAGFNARILLQLIPVILILLLLLNFIPSSQPVYSLSETYPYQYKFTTQKGVNYFVKSSKFEKEYPRDSKDRLTLEEQVERDYVSILSQNCKYELQRKQWLCS